MLVLGCGPAGLFAAHAARSLGFAVDILSRKRRSEMFGAQYLHTDIPGLTDDQHPFEVEYRLNGSLDSYLHKVYGEKIPDPGKITVESLVGKYPAWDIRRAYLKAWDIYGGDISHTNYVGAPRLFHLLADDSWTAIVSTIPAPDICRSRENSPIPSWSGSSLYPYHTFSVRRIWAVGDAPERGQFAPDYVGEPNVILYDGTPNVRWYRASRIAGYNAVEWPWGSAKTIAQGFGSSVNKPIGTNCNCWSHVARPLIRVGRYGAWDRTGHTHQAYWQTLEALKDL